MTETVKIYIPLVIPITPALDPTISMQKSGAWPVIPNMVVLRYFSCPARSMNVITLVEARQICTQSRPPEREKERGESGTCNWTVNCPQGSLHSYIYLCTN